MWDAAFLQDITNILTTNGDGQVKVFDVASGEILYRFICSILKHVIITTVDIDHIYLIKWKTRHLCFDNYPTNICVNIS